MQDDGGGGERVWVPSIALGWDGPGFRPPPPAKFRGEGTIKPFPKTKPNFNDDYDGCDGDAGLPLKGNPHKMHDQFSKN